MAGRIDFDSAVVLAPEGQVDLVAVREGFVSLDPKFGSLVREFGEISLRDLALVDTSSSSGGKIFVDTGSLSLTSGSHILNQSTNATVGSGGEIVVRASESVEVAGISEPTPILIPPSQGQAIFSSIASEAISGAVAPITIEAPSIRLVDGGTIASIAFEAGSGGRIAVDTQNLSISGATSTIPFPNPSLVFSFAGGISNGSDIAIDAESINISTSGGILAASVEFASAGDIEIDSETIQVTGVAPFFEDLEVASRISSQNGSLSESAEAGKLEIATETIQVTGVAPFFEDLEVASRISSQNGSLSESAEAGKLEIATESLQVLNGGTINTNTSASSNAGTIDIEADEVTVDGVGGNTALSSNISSSSIFVVPIPGIEDALLGNGGNVEINSDSIAISDGGSIGVANIGQGQGGNIAFNAEEIRLSNGDIVANASSDSGGAIFIDSSFLMLENTSTISVNSIAGDAGSIVLDSLVIVEPGSQITADSVSGDLGVIDITDEFDFNVEPTLPDFVTVERSLAVQQCTVEDRGRFVRTFNRERSLAAQWILPSEAEGFAFDAEGNAILIGSDARLIATCRQQFNQEALEPSNLPQKS